MERARIVNGLRVILTQERFTATRIGSPGCRVRRIAEDNIATLEAAIALLDPPVLTLEPMRDARGLLVGYSIGPGAPRK